MSEVREYADAEILALRHRYRETQAARLPASQKIHVGTDSLPLYREILFGGMCSIMLPQSMTDMDRIERMVRYQGRNRPPVIRKDADREAAVTFSLLPMPGGGEAEPVTVQLAELRSDMKKIWKQNIFYDSGEVEADRTAVAWMDLKAYCLDGNLYSMIFLFRAQGQTVLGNFHCNFPRYDVWKPTVLKLLATVQVRQEGTDSTFTGGEFGIQ